MFYPDYNDTMGDPWFHSAQETGRMPTDRSICGNQATDSSTWEVCMCQYRVQQVEIFKLGIFAHGNTTALQPTIAIMSTIACKGVNQGMCI